MNTLNVFDAFILVRVSVYNESNVSETIAEINKHLPKTVIVNEIKRVTKAFNCKNACDARTYRYLMPTYALSNVAPLPLPLMTSELEALSPQESRDRQEAETAAYEAHEKYKVTQDVVDKANDLLAKYIGPHFYHNFTSGK